MVQAVVVVTGSISEIIASTPAARGFRVSMAGGLFAF